jgi:hypothetical protein
VRRIVPILILGALLWGCADTPSLDQWQERAEQTCSGFQDDTESVVDDLGAAEDLTETADLLEELQPRFEDYVSELKSLGTPSESGDDVQAYYDTLDEEVDAFDALVQAAQDDDENDFFDASDELNGLSNDAVDLADGLGLDSCAEVA